MNSDPNVPITDINLDNKKTSESIECLQECAKEKEESKKKIQSLEKENSNLKESNDSLSVQKKEIEQLLEEKNDIINKLENFNSNLKVQASKYQSALGAATNFRLDDEDNNNPVQLKEDILSLQDALEIYVTNLRPNIDVDFKNVNDLLNKYQSETRVTSKSNLLNIPLIKAVLQRHVLETIFSYANMYFDYKDADNPYSLEAQIVLKADELMYLVKEFVNTREGDDNTTPSVPVKIRQQIYSALGNRGFSNIINEREKYEHNFINHFKTELNKEMELYRKILDDTKKKEIEQKAANIILSVIRIFYLRLRTQEPMSQYKWFHSKDKIDPSLMIMTYDDDEFDDFEVDICKFPLTGIELNNDSKRKIYTQALIYPRKVNSN
jgi:hypothetical protein